MSSPLHRSSPHGSARAHVTGSALYVDDLPGPAGTLVAACVPASLARARILRRDASAALALPGVHAVLFADQVPGSNLIGPVVHDEPLLAEQEVFFKGQTLALVVAETWEQARAAVAAVEVELEPLHPVLDLREAIAREDWLLEHHVIERGEVEQALAGAALVIEGELESGGQDHFYLETQASLCLPEEDGSFRLLSSTQHPTEMQRMAASALGIGAHRVICEVPRMGGGFGGKESQSTNYGVLAALASQATGRPVRMWLDRDQDMRITGKRHPFLSRYRAGFDAEGRLLAFDAVLTSDGGWCLDLSGPILDRALFHVDNAYYVPHIRLEGRIARTNLPSNTAFRGFGGPQGMLVLEDALHRYAERTGADPVALRRKNYYREGQALPYGQVLRDLRLERITEELLASSDYAARRTAIEAFNAQGRSTRRGIAFHPVKFGISFTASLLNQAGALVLIYADGSVQINHGGTEMGQGLHTKMRAIAAHGLGVPVERVRVMRTSTEKVPNTSPTAASSGSDLNGQAVRLACETLRARMAEVERETGPLPFDQLAAACWARRVSLSATGFYATPGVAYDRKAGQGTPFFYFAYGAAVSEVELNAWTGEYRLRAVDILHDVGDPLVPSIDIGQVEGGFVQGLGWLSCEEVLYDDQGGLLTHSPSTYKIPAVGDVPVAMRVKLLEGAAQEGVVHGSKAVGEPPFMLALSFVGALRHAIASFGPGEVALALPATPEAVLRAIEAQRAR